MEPEVIILKDVPPEFMQSVKVHFRDYSVALGRVINGNSETYTNLGSGVLIRRGNRYGMLTAYHCLHSSTPEVRIGPKGTDDLMLQISRQNVLMLKPTDVFEHVLAKPIVDEFGPDLTFIEILPGSPLSTCKAIGSFWSLDRSSLQVMKDFGVPGTITISVGFPAAFYDVKVINKNIHQRVWHMSYVNVVEKSNLFEKDGWDYLDSTIDYSGSSIKSASSSPELPDSFAGMSGGPVWGGQIKRDKNTHELSIVNDALIGITFYQTGTENGKRRLRAHFIKSIYDLGWKAAGL